MKRPRPRFWAVVTTNEMMAVSLAGYRRDASTALRAKGRVGFVLDVYPDEVSRYERSHAKDEILGRFDTVEEAYACLEQWTGQ